MNLHTIDYLVLAIFFVGAAGIGLFFSRRSAKSYKGYFLGS